MPAGSPSAAASVRSSMPSHPIAFSSKSTPSSTVFAVLKETLDSGERELRLIAAQDAIASPACEFEVEQVR